MSSKSPKTPSQSKPLFFDEYLDHIIADDMLGGDWSPIQNKLDVLKAALMERMLKGEMTHHLGYTAGEEAPTEITNRRNGTSCKTLQTDNGQ
jgi:Transposase, Mutator family